MSTVDGNRWQCTACGAVTLIGKTACFKCGAARNDTPALTGKPKPPKRRRKPRAQPTNKVAPRSRTQYASLDDYPGPLRLVVYGEPRSQGSFDNPKLGVLKPSDSELMTWRQAVNAEGKRVCGPDWVAPNAPIDLTLVFTVRLPANAPKAKAVHADGWRDIDKLTRAIQDGICEPCGFRVIASDMRTARTTVTKTHPRPLHTHPLALDRPGVCIEVRPLRTAPVVDGPAPVSSPVFRAVAA